MKRRIYVTLCFAAAFLLVSCSTTPQDRIEDNPAVFAALPDWEKSQVVQGQVAVGMSPDAVKLAWGAPQSIVTGDIGGNYAQRWVYEISYPVYGPTYGYGGWYGPFPRAYYYAPVYRPVDYVPVDVGYVLFQNNKVVSWEHSK